MGYTKRHGIMFRLASLCVLCLFMFNAVSVDVQPSVIVKTIAHRAAMMRILKTASITTDLAPTTLFMPMVKIVKQGEKFAIVEDWEESEKLMVDLGGAQDDEERMLLKEQFKEDVAFVYISHLVAQALEFKLSESALKDLIRQHLPHIDFNRFIWEEMTAQVEESQISAEQRRIISIPYIRKDASHLRQALKFYLEVDEKTDVETSDSKIDRIYGYVGSIAKLTIRTFKRDGRRLKVILEDPPLTMDGGVAPGHGVAFNSPFGNARYVAYVKDRGERIKVQAPDKSAEKFLLNDGAVAVDSMRFLFTRRVTDRVHKIGPSGDGILESGVALFIHDEETNATKSVDRNMLFPRGEHMLAYEDPRVFERDGNIVISVTVVERKGRGYVYYSATTKHPTHNEYNDDGTLKAEGFMEKARRKMDDPAADVDWGWPDPEKTLKEGFYAEHNYKNFVMFADPVEINGMEYWYALYRPDELDRSTIRLAVAEKLDGPWRDAGLYMAMDEDLGWLGPSVDVTGIPGDSEFGVMIIHKGKYRDALKKKKYYDIRLLIYDRKDPRSFHVTDPVLVPHDDEAEDSWVQGVIYTCGEVLRKYVPRRVQTGYLTELALDIYSSVNDAYVVMDSLTVVVTDPPGRARHEFDLLYQEFKEISEIKDILYAPEVPQRLQEVRDGLEEWNIVWGDGFGDAVTSNVLDMILMIEEVIAQGDEYRSIRHDQRPKNVEAAPKIYALMESISRTMELMYGVVNNSARKLDEENFILERFAKKPHDLISELRSLEKRAKRVMAEEGPVVDRKHLRKKIEGEGLVKELELWKYHWDKNEDVQERAPQEKTAAISGNVREIIRKIEAIGRKKGEARQLNVGDVASSVEALFRTVNEQISNIMQDVFQEEHQARVNSPIWFTDEVKAAAIQAEKTKKKTAGKQQQIPAKEEGHEIIIGLEDEWLTSLSDNQRRAIQELLADLENEFSDHLKKGVGITNVKVIRGRGDSLAEQLLKRAQRTNTPLKNIVVMGGSEKLKGGAFEKLKSEEGSAFMAGVDATYLLHAQQNLAPSEELYICLLDMLAVSIKLAFNNSRVSNKELLKKLLKKYPFIGGVQLSQNGREIIFYPAIKPVDYENELLETYEMQRREMLIRA